MSKTASQLVPLKTQLASTVNMCRFADTSDINTAQVGYGNSYTNINSTKGTWEERIWDYSGSVNVPLYGAPSVPASFTASCSGSPTLAAPTASASGGTMRPLGVWYRICAVDSSGKEGPYAEVFTTSTNNNFSVVLNWATVPNVNTWKIWKFTNSSTSGYYGYISNNTNSNYTMYNIPATTLTLTDTYNVFSGFSSTPSGATQTYSAPPASGPSRTSTVTQAPTFTVTYGTGGQRGPDSWAYAVSAVNAVGETVPTAYQYATIGSNYNPLIPGQAPSAAPTATATTGTGSLAAGTYYYKITALTSWGESLPSAEATATLGAAGNVQLTWSSISTASSYNVYRGTTSGGETYLTNTVATSFQDIGSITPQTGPPPQYYLAGPADTCSVSLSWSSITNATTYRVYGRWNSTVGYSGTNLMYIANQAGTTYTDTGSGTIGYGGVSTVYRVPVTNGTGIAWTRAYQPIKLDAQGTLIHRVGMTFTPVAGKRYRAALYYTSNGQNYGNYLGAYSAWWTATTSTQQYVEWTLDAYQEGTYDNSQWTATSWVGIEGADSGATFTVPNVTVPSQPSLTDTYGNFTNGYGNAMFCSGYSNQGNGAYTMENSSTPGDYQGATSSLTSFNLPIKIVRRVPTSPVSIRGTLVAPTGSGQGLQRTVTPNYTYSSAVRSIVPSWANAVGNLLPYQQINGPTRSYRGPFPMGPSSTTNMGGNPEAQTYEFVKVEVSTDVGNSWTEITNQTRYTFPTPTTQMMFRFTQWPSGAYATFGTGGGITIGTSYNNGKGWYSDTGQYTYYNSPSNDMYVNSNGDGVQCGTYYGGTTAYTSMVFFQGAAGIGDHDITASGYTSNSSSHFCVMARAADYNNGYQLDLVNSGTVSLYSRVGGTNTTLGSVALGSSFSAYNQLHTLRLNVAGNHILGWVDGRLVFDLNDSSISNSTWRNCGAGGYYAWVFQMYGAGPGFAANQNELEAFSAFLEY